MSVTILPGQHLLGVPLTRVRNILKAWRYGGSSDVVSIAERNDVELDPLLVLILLEELRERGLIGEEADEIGDVFDGLTPTGEALAHATARKRTPKAKARKVLEEFLAACERINARRDLPVEILEVWLFGSMLDPNKADVADIDLSVLTGTPADFKGDIIKRYDELAKAMGRTSIPQGVQKLWHGQQFVMNQLLYGGRRHPLLAVHFDGHALLRDMACPCQQLLAKDGRTSDAPILPRHPSSTGRAKRIKEPGVMPDLKPSDAPLRPISSDWALSTRLWSRHAANLAPWPSSHPRNWMARERLSAGHLLVGAEAYKRLKPNVVTRRLDLVSDCDQRDRTSFVIAGSTFPDPKQRWLSVERAEIGVVFDREIKATPKGIVYKLTINRAAQRGKVPGFGVQCAALWWMWLLAQADLRRIALRDAEAFRSRPVRVRVEDATDSQIGLALAEDLRATVSAATHAQR
ncbi:unknown protein [Azorhizobium caulinodans ORS 571]|uniref:Uncharacterized protein n=1 Tax=Azorhizobium caulinodans (strain ATCC 43989 / DSM 5975 / JCM 20966 / LMG 6465 / NBRC 14845 / NCIMB 13405 / ORS 571) TaxID=438753 RepID=A8HTR8_AZOC5|nr:hypothetical protein [Azorhizobium caulinodans]BAF86863.1 unknown protein [Azorhizobium caulinodans ORS 571]